MPTPPNWSFDYDPNGNLTRSVDPVGTATTAYLYDVENRLVAASGASNAALVYDPLGRLFEVTGANGAKTQFLYDGDDLVAEYDGLGSMTRRYVHGPEADDPAAVYEGPGRGLANRRYMLPDERGSIAALVNADGTPSTINRYDAWGIPGAGNGGRFQYTGQTWIGELGLYYYKARLYSPWLGRFMQTDPIGYEGGINLYEYVSDDPVNHTDPSGKCFWDACMVEGYVAVMVVATVAMGVCYASGACAKAGDAVQQGVDHVLSQRRKGQPVPGTGKEAGRPQRATVKPGRPGPPRVVRPTHPPKKSDVTQEAARGGRHGGVIGSKGDRERMGGRQDQGHQGGPPHGHPPEGQGRGHLWERPGVKNDANP